MTIRRLIPILLVICLSPAVGHAAERTVLLPPEQGIYHSAFPDFGGPESFVTRDRLRDFERLVDKDIAWAYFSDNWFNGIGFPTQAVEVISQYKRVPFIRMMARSNYKQKPSKYTLQKILNGDFDDDLHDASSRSPTGTRAGATPTAPSRTSASTHPSAPRTTTEMRSPGPST